MTPATGVRQAKRGRVPKRFRGPANRQMGYRTWRDSRYPAEIYPPTPAGFVTPDMVEAVARLGKPEPAK